MKIIEINACSFGSTGNIMLNIAKRARMDGIDAYTASSIRLAKQKNIENHYYFDNTFLFNCHRVLGYITGCEISFSFISTLNLIRMIDKIKPDIVHLHNIHGWYLNSKLLFSYIKKKNLKVIWTFHDCWPFTGHCPHFEYEKCEKWKSECSNCPRYNDYPKSLFDNSKKMFHLKKRLFTSINNLTVVTPSNWLNNKVKQSFLNKYDVVTINNGIDLNVFKPTPSSFRSELNLKDYFVILGVASGWSEKKGYDVFLDLAKKLDDRVYRIVLVGLNESQMKLLPSNVVGIRKTNSVDELIKIYSAADLFINPTREDTFPTVNIEALACGVPVVTYNTGGSVESIDKQTGMVIEDNDVNTLIKTINKIYHERPFNPSACRNKALEFDKNNKYKEYISLYRRVSQETKTHNNG